MSNNKQMSVEKDFVPYQEAIVLKELGFDEPCLAAYYVFGDGRLIDGSYGQTEPELFINGIGKELEDRMEELKMFAYCATLVPTFSQAFRWLREKYGLYYFEDHRCNSKTDISSITYWMGIKRHKLAPFGSEVLVGIIELGCYNTYEEAELACIRKLIEIVKKKHNEQQ